MLILINVQYLEKIVFILWKRFPWSNASTSVSNNLIKKSIPPLGEGWIYPPPNYETLLGKPEPVTYPGFFGETINYDTDGYVVNADGHLID